MIEATPTTFGNVFEDSIEVLYAPSTVFERSRNRGYGKYLLVLILIAIVVTAVVAGLVRPWMDATFDLTAQLAAARGKPIPEQAVASMRKFGGYFFYTTPMVIVVGSAFVSGLLLLVGGKIVQAPVRYSQAVLIATLASVPRIIAIFVSGVEALVMNGETARSAYDLSIGPARFMDPTKISPVLMQLVNGVDLFNLWQLVIFGVGMAVMARVSRSTGMIAGLLAWVLGTAIPLLPSLLTG